MSIDIALVHYPVSDKRGDVAATSITNFDIHDLARAARTYGVSRYYIVSPIKSQKDFAQRIIRHWSDGYGSEYNPSRGTALEIAKIIDDISEIVEDVEDRMDKPGPVFVGTSAKEHPNTVMFRDMRKKLKEDRKHYCLVFGTGWGIHPSLLMDLDFILEPVRGVGSYNHLSVRSAVSIILDRLLGEW